MARFLQKADIVAAGFAEAATDIGLITATQFPGLAASAGLLTSAAVPPLIPPILDGLKYKPEPYRIVQPDSGGNSAPLLNDTLAQLNALGGGTLILDSGGAPFSVDQTINARYSDVSIISRSSKGVISLQKGNNFPDGDTLLSVRGDGSSGNTGTSHNSDGVLQGFALSGRAPNNVQKAGYLLDTSYTGGFRYESLMLRRCPNTAWYREEEWDSFATDMRFPNCGGSSGETDAVMRIVSSAADSSNNLIHVGMWFESFPHMFCHITEGANASGLGPYNILFMGVKAESINLVANAVMFRASEKCRTVRLKGAIIAVGGVNTVGGIVYGIENNGPQCITEDINFDIRSTDFVSGGVTIARKPTVGWCVKAPTSSSLGGGVIRDIYTAPSAAAVNSIVNLSNTNSGGGSLDFQGKLLVEGLRPANASWPLFSGTGWDSAYAVANNGAKIPQLNGVPGTTQVNTATTGTPNVTLRKGHATNRQPLPISYASPGTATIPQGLAIPGDVIEIVQEGASAVTLTPFSGVTLDVPTGLSATTAGQGRSVRARCLATNAYRVIG